MSREVTQQSDPWVKVPHWLIGEVMKRQIQPSAVVVYAALAHYATMPDGARPALKMVATDTGFGLSTVQRSVNDLAAVGALTVEARWADDEHRVRLPSRYHLFTTKHETPLVVHDQTPLVVDDLPPVPRTTKELEEEQEEEDLLGSTPRTSSATSKGNHLTDVLFCRFYDATYPRKAGRQAAWAKWQTKVIRAGVDPEHVIARAALFAEVVRRKGTETDYIAHPATWLHAGRWDDAELDQVKPAAERPAGPPAEILDDGPAMDRWYEQQARLAAERRTVGAR